MQIRLFAITPIIYYSFALDSLLKVNLGFQLHLGILCILALNSYFLVRKPQKLFPAISNDKLLFAFVGFAIVGGVINSTPAVKQIAVYLFIAVNVALYCHYTWPSIGPRQLRTFQWIMIVTGLVQYTSYKVFGYQIAFIDVAHYEKGYSVTHRLRGFFVEPNWYAIALTFNTLLLYGRDVWSNIKSYRLLSLLTLMVMLLNGTLATLGVLILVYFGHAFRRNPVRGVAVGVVLAAVMWGFLSYRASLIGGDSSNIALNHGSRVLPVLRVANYQAQQEWPNVLFGHGLGSWGTKAIENRLSVLVYEINASTRDGSELPVFLFEFGLVGTLLFFIYLLNKAMRITRDNFHYRGAVLLFFVCFLLYPTLKFWMYMPYFFFAMSYLNEQKYAESFTPRS